MRSVLSLSGQSVWDISIKHMGSVDPVFDILKLNPSIRIDQTIPTGTIVFVPETPTKQRVVDYYELNSINPSTGIV